jgi:hypothetical protein
VQKPTSRKAKIIFTCLLLLTSTSISLILAEITLGVANLYSDLILVELTPSNTIYSKPGLSTDYQMHPDLKTTTTLRYDALGIRNEKQIDPKRTINAVGFFGDSFTENRYIEERFTLTGLLSEYEDQERFFNFGIAGYGIDQSFQRWRNYSPTINFSDVVYIFYHNDITDILQTNLFIVSNAKDTVTLTNRIDHGDYDTASTSILRLLGKLRITYLALDAYYQLRGRLYPEADWPRRLADYFGNNAADLHQKNIRDKLSKKSANRAEESVLLFKTVLAAWKLESEAAGSRFHILVLPIPGEHEILARTLGSDYELYDVIFSSDTTNSIFPANTYPLQFDNDDHWNEFGNLFVLSATVKALNLLQKNQEDLDNFIEEKLLSIRNNYCEKIQKYCPSRALKEP